MKDSTKKYLMWAGGGALVIWIMSRSSRVSAETTEEMALIGHKVTVYFDFDSSRVKAESQNDLNDLAQMVRGQDFRIHIIGHTDSVGDYTYNVNLSRERAERVADYLIARGVTERQIVQVGGVGPDQPIATNDTEEGRALNRRVEVIVEARD
jgi:outer membrane protein OmpA-like peptidoglycan-associated protein